MAVSSQDIETGQGLIERLGLSFALSSDPDLRVIEAYGVRHEGEDIAVPAVFLIDQERRVRYHYIGESMIDRPSSEELVELLATY